MSTPLLFPNQTPVVRPLRFSRLQRSVGGRGVQGGKFDNCSALTTLSNGDVAVVDTNNNRIQLLTSQLALRTCVGQKRLRSPWGVASLPFDKFCVSEGPKNRVAIYTNSGEFVSKFTVADAEEICCLATCPVTGNIVVTDYGSATVRVCNLEGEVLRSFSSQVESEGCEPPVPEHIACDKHGRVFMSFGEGAKHVQVFDRGGKFLFRFGGHFTSAAGLYVTARDNLVLCERNERSVSMYSTSGQFIQPLVNVNSGLSMFPHDVTIVNGSDVIVACSEDMFACPTWLHWYKIS